MEASSWEERLEEAIEGYNNGGIWIIKNDYQFYRNLYEETGSLFFFQRMLDLVKEDTYA